MSTVHGAWVKSRNLRGFRAVEREWNSSMDCVVSVFCLVALEGSNQASSILPSFPSLNLPFLYVCVDPVMQYCTVGLGTMKERGSSNEIMDWNRMIVRSCVT